MCAKSSFNGLYQSSSEYKSTTGRCRFAISVIPIILLIQIVIAIILIYSLFQVRIASPNLYPPTPERVQIHSHRLLSFKQIMRDHTSGVSMSGFSLPRSVTTRDHKFACQNNEIKSNLTPFGFQPLFWFIFNDWGFHINTTVTAITR